MTQASAYSSSLNTYGTSTLPYSTCTRYSISTSWPVAYPGIYPIQFNYTTVDALRNNGTNSQILWTYGNTGAAPIALAGSQVFNLQFPALNMSQVSYSTWVDTPNLYDPMLRITNTSSSPSTGISLTFNFTSFPSQTRYFLISFPSQPSMAFCRPVPMAACTTSPSSSPESQGERVLAIVLFVFAGIFGAVLLAFCVFCVINKRLCRRGGSAPPPAHASRWSVAPAAAAAMNRPSAPPPRSFSPAPMRVAEIELREPPFISQYAPQPQHPHPLTFSPTFQNQGACVVGIPLTSSFYDQNANIVIGVPTTGPPHPGYPSFTSASVMPASYEPMFQQQPQQPQEQAWNSANVAPQAVDGYGFEQPVIQGYSQQPQFTSAEAPMYQFSESESVRRSN